MARPAPRLFLFDDPAQLSQAAAEIVVAAAASAVDSLGRFHCVLAGGRTPLDSYRLLAKPPLRDAMPWPDIFWYWSDERAVPPAHAESNYRQAREALLAHVPAPPERIIRMRGELAPEEAADDYKDALADLASENRLWPRFDLVILGLGEDGHTASLFPGESAYRQPVVAIPASQTEPAVARITLTPLALNSAHHVLFLVSGAAKAKAVAGTFSDDQGAEARWPARSIRPAAGRVTWLLDDAAAALLPWSIPSRRWADLESGVVGALAP